MTAPRYRDQNFGQRFAAMGDQAEAVYEAVHPLGRTVRFGWRRPKGISIKLMPNVIRHAPDYYADAGYLIEIMGLGRDGILKSFKLDKWSALKAWAALCAAGGAKLVFFIWNSHEDTYAVVDWDGAKRLVNRARHRGIEEFNDGNRYYAIPFEEIKEEAAIVGRWTDDND